MTPRIFYEDGEVTVIHGDCREVLPELGEFDALVVDPPWGVDFQYGTGHDDSPDTYAAFLWPIIQEAEQHLRPGSPVAVFQASVNARRWAEWFPREWRLIALPKMFAQLRNKVTPTYATDYVLMWRTPGGEKPTHQEWMPRGNRDWYVSRTPNFGLGALELPGKGDERTQRTIAPLPQCQRLVVRCPLRLGEWCLSA